jgi:hypothetical protein
MDIAQQAGHIPVTTSKTAPTARQGSFSEGMCGTFMVTTAANMGGLGLGPLLAGLFAQFGPDPTVLVFEVYLAVLATGPSAWSSSRRPSVTGRS